MPPSLPTQIFGGDDGGDQARNRLAAAGLAAATVFSALILWLVTQNFVLVGGLLAGMVAFWAVADFLRRNRSPELIATALPPDWSVTRAVADQDEAAVAITDRAGRLLCANDLFTKAFEGLRAPPDLGLDEASHELLMRAGRAGWRDGSTTVDGVKHNGSEFQVRVSRAGAGDEYLMWRFAEVAAVNVVTQANDLVSGRIGRALASAGVMAVTVGTEGRVRTSNAAFAVRATGDENANIANRDLGSFLRLDDKGRVFFEREGPRGIAVRLLHVPLSDDAAKGNALLLAIDDAGGQSGDRSSALVHVEQLLSNLPLGLALVNRDGRFLFANESFARVAGLTPDAMPPYPGDLVISEDKSAVSDSIRRYAAGQAHAGDIAVRLKDQPDEVTALSIAGVRGLGDAAVLIGLKDNSEETKLKRQVAQATKMQAVGQLAGGVAHDFNNILTAIIGYCDLMLLRHPPGDSDYDDIQQIRQNSNRAASLTRQLLAFSRQQTLRPQILQLPDVVAEVSHLLKRLLGETVKLDVQHGRSIGVVRADPGQLEQVIVNLGVNEIGRAHV